MIVWVEKNDGEYEYQLIKFILSFSLSYFDLWSDETERTILSFAANFKWLDKYFLENQSDFLILKMFGTYSAEAEFSIYLVKFIIYGASYGNVSRMLLLSEYDSNTSKMKKVVLILKLLTKYRKTKTQKSRM